MKKFLIGAALMMIGATAHAETYQVEGMTIQVPTHCASPSCVSVDGYGYHHEARRAKVSKTVKTAAVAPKKADRIEPAAATPAADAPVAATQAAPAPETAPAPAPEVTAAPAGESAPAK